MNFLAIVKLIPLKVWVALLLFVGAAIWGYGEIKYNNGVSDTETRYTNAPVKRDTTWLHDTLRPPPVILPPLPPEIVQDPRAQYLVDSLFAAGASKDSIIRSWAQQQHADRTFSSIAEIKDSPHKLELRGTLYERFSHFDGFRGWMRFDPVVVPIREVTVTHYVPQPQHFVDLYVRGGLAGYWLNPFFDTNAGLIELGATFRLGEVTISAAPGVAFQEGQITGVHSLWFGWEFTK